MKPELIHVMEECIRGLEVELTDKEHNFVLYYAFHTGNEANAKDIMKKFAEASTEEETEKIIEQYAKDIDAREKWIVAIEEFYICMERLHLEEKEALDRLEKVLKDNGINLVEKEVE